MNDKVDNQKVNILNHPLHLDFENKQEEADKWGHATYDDWFNKKLTKNERKVLVDFPKESYLINAFLEITEGRITNLPKEKNYKERFKKFNIQKIISEIKTIDKALKKTKTQHSIQIYKLVDESFFDAKQEELIDPLIDQLYDYERYAQFVEKYSIENKKIDGFLLGSLTNNSSVLDKFNNKPQNILLKIKIPPHIHAAYLGTNSIGDFGRSSMIINRNQTLAFNNFKIINTSKKHQIIEAEIITS